MNKIDRNAGELSDRRGGARARPQARQEFSNSPHGLDGLLDQALEDTFPASDPVSSLIYS